MSVIPDSDKGILFESKTFNWKMRLSTLLDIPKKERFYSPHFIQGECVWSLAVGRNGEWIGGYLRLEQFKNKKLTKGDTKIRATYRIKIEIESQNLKEERKSSWNFLINGRGWPKLFSFDPASVGKDDILMVSCQIWTKDRPGAYNPILKQESGYSLLSFQIGGLLDDSILTDLSIQVGGEELKAHKSILAARSQVFRRMFESGMLEAAESQLIIEDFSKEVVQRMLEFVYSGDINLIRKGDVPLTDLLQISDKYELVQLKGVCEALLSKNLTVENVMEILSLADMQNAPTLKKQTLEYIVKNSDQVFKTKAYIEMKSVEIMQEICSALAKK